MLYSKVISPTNWLSKPLPLDEPGLFPITENVMGDLVDGILILTDKKEILYANKNAIQILNQLSQDINASHIPSEIWHVCTYLIQSKKSFPHQRWLIQADILIAHKTALHVRAKWLAMEIFDCPCMILMIEDRHQAVQDMAIAKADHYGLTPREKEVWLLQQNGCTYKQIARELEITPNTVKKHMRSIHSKQKNYLDPELVG